MTTGRYPLQQYLRIVNTSLTRTSHPLHPATTHLPIALLLLAYGLDILTILPAFVLKTLVSLPLLGPVVSDVNGSIPLAAHHILTLAVLSAIPTIITGIIEINGMMSRYDLVGKLSKSPKKLDVIKKMPEKLKIAFVHAMVMDAVVFASVWSLMSRKKSNAYAFDGNMAWLSLALPVFLFGGSALGGQLVFDHGVGVKRSTSKSE